MSIYSLAIDYYKLMARLEEQEGVMTPEDELELAINSNNLEAKLHDYRDVRLRIKSDVVMLKEKKEILDNNIKSVETFKKRLDKYVLDAVNIFGNNSKTGKGKSIKYTDLTVFSKTMPRLVFTDEPLYIGRLATALDVLTTFAITDVRLADLTDDVSFVSALLVSDIASVNINITVPVTNYVNTIAKLNSVIPIDTTFMSSSINLNKKALLNLVSSINEIDRTTDCDTDNTQVALPTRSLIEGVSINEEADIIVMK